MTSLLKMEVLFSYANYLDHQYSFNTPYFTYKYITYAWSNHIFRLILLHLHSWTQCVGKQQFFWKRPKTSRYCVNSCTNNILSDSYSRSYILIFYSIYIFYRECFVLDVILTRTNWSRHKRISSLRMSKSVFSWFMGTVQVSLIGTRLLGPQFYSSKV